MIPSYFLNLLMIIPIILSRKNTNIYLHIYRLYIHIFNCTYENRNTNFYHQYIISYILIYERTFFYISPKYNILPWFVYKPGCSSNKSSFFISFFNSACLPLMSSKTISYTELLILS